MIPPAQLLLAVRYPGDTMLMSGPLAGGVCSFNEDDGDNDATIVTEAVEGEDEAVMHDSIVVQGGDAGVQRFFAVPSKESMEATITALLHAAAQGSVSQSG